MPKPRKPRGLKAAGSRLWESVNNVFELDDEPHKVEILAQAAKVADLISDLDRAAASSPLTVRGSAGQQVISPTLAEARFQRGLLSQLVARLGLPDSEEEAAEKSAKLSRTRAESGRQKYASKRANLSVVQGG
jgi:hypothetical protein